MRKNKQTSKQKQTKKIKRKFKIENLNIANKKEKENQPKKAI